MLLVSKSQQAKGIRHKHAEGQNRQSPSNGPAHRRLPKDAAVRIVERQRGMPSSRPGSPSYQAPCSNPSAQPALIWLDLKRQQMLWSIWHECHEEHQQMRALTLRKMHGKRIKGCSIQHRGAAQAAFVSTRRPTVEVQRSSRVLSRRQLSGRLHRQC
jgi:hypothetical protein